MAHAFGDLSRPLCCDDFLKNLQGKTSTTVITFTSINPGLPAGHVVLSREWAARGVIILPGAAESAMGRYCCKRISGLRESNFDSKLARAPNVDSRIEFRC
jgi:hypothetical protein